MIANPSVVVHLLVTKFGVRDPCQYGEEVSHEEQRIAQVIGELIGESCNGQCEIDEDYCLYDGIDDDDDDDGESFQRPDEPGPSKAAEEEGSSMSDSDEEPAGSSSPSSYHPSPKKAALTRLDEQYTVDRMRTIVEFAGNHGNKAAFKRWSSLGNSAEKLNRMKKFLKDGGHRLSKLDQLKNFKYTHFRDARDQLLPVHGHDLKSWFMEGAKILKIDKFKASTGFLHDLKTKFKMSSRNVTKFVIKRTRDDGDAIKQRADEFVEMINEMKSGAYSNSNVWNTVGVQL